MKRNWIEICKIKDYYLRVAISLTTDPELLACFAKGFPHLFLDGDDAGPLKVPLSALMEAARKYSEKQEPDKPESWEEDRHFVLSFGSENHSHLDLPVSFDWGLDRDYPDPPQSVLDQLVGQKAQAGMLISYEDKRYLVYDIIFTHDYPQIGTTFVEPPRVNNISLVLAEFVDLNA